MTEVFVTGLGVISSIGSGVQENLASLRAGKSGISKSHSLCTRLDVPLAQVHLPESSGAGVPSLSGTVPTDESPVTKTALLAVQAVSEALGDAGLNPSEMPVGVILGTSVGGMDLGEIFYGDSRKDPSSGHIRLMKHYDCAASTDYV